MTPASVVESKRDPRIDVLRGIALLMIFVDHIPGNTLGSVTLRNFGFSDAAEVFVLLAGMSAVLAFGRVFEREGARSGLRRIVLRLVRIYLFQIGLLLTTLAIVLMWTTYHQLQPTLVAPILNAPVSGIARGFTLQAVPAYLDILPLYLVLLLPWTPCAAAWSVDSWLHRHKREPDAQSVGFSVYACFAVMAVIYLVSGLSKVHDSGLEWFHGGNIESKLVKDALSPIFFDYKWKATIWLVQHHAPDYVFTIIGTVGLIVELGYVTVLFSRTAQIIMPIAALGVHVGILVFQHILFPDLLMLQLIFLNVDWVTNFCGRHFRTGDRAASAQVRNDIPPRLLSYLPAVATALMVAIFFVAWVWSVEYYPLSSWQMYSYAQPKGPLHYLKVIATLENGRSIVIPTRDFSPAWLPSGRDILARVFRTTRHSEKFDAFLSFYVQRRNRNLMFGSPITRMEIQLWRWNYLVDPNDPRFGWAIGVYPYDVPSKPSPSR